MMKKRVFRFVLDLSMSNKDMIGPIYLFLTRLLQKTADDPSIRYSLTVFTGEKTGEEEPECTAEVFPGGKVTTDQPAAVLNAIRNKVMVSGPATTDQTLEKAVRLALTMREEEEQEWETVLILFTDYRTGSLMFNKEEDPGLRRSILFLPGNILGSVNTGFRFLTEDGITRNIPVQLYAMEDLCEVWNEQDWSSFLQMM